MKLDKVRQEFLNFYVEMFRVNRHRYRDPKEWLHLYVDFWVSLFSMSYTLGHVMAVLVPVLIVVGVVY